jgi:hypothetical protein
VFPKEWKEPLGGEKVGFPGKVGLPRGVEGASRWGEGWFPGNGILPKGVDGTSWRGQGGFPRKGSLPLGDTTTMDYDVPEDWM